ncbi:MAG TPA: hypothetical protein VFE50_09055, partial [Cyclobacteriaceae bacterium]|nr:hypothetical protein [Cyclobacteriaceae bacterium]
SLEISHHKKILRFAGEEFKKDKVIDLIWNDNKVPLWINISVISIQNNRTTIELLMSRRLRAETDLNHVAEKFPPFHPVMPSID